MTFLFCIWSQSHLSKMARKSASQLIRLAPCQSSFSLIGVLDKANLPLDLCIDSRLALAFESETLHHLFNFTSYSTSLNCPVDPCTVFEAETPHHLLDFVHSSCQSLYCLRSRNTSPSIQLQLHHLLGFVRSSCQSLYCLRSRNTSPSIRLCSLVLSIPVLPSKPKHFTIYSIPPLL